jgi:hypothetical protein
LRGTSDHFCAPGQSLCCGVREELLALDAKVRVLVRFDF